MQAALLLILSFAMANSFFWEEKPALSKRLLENKEILVSVTNLNQRTHFKGGGLILAPASEVVLFATNPALVKSAVPELKEFDWDPSKGPFKAKIRFLGFEKEIEGLAKHLQEKVELKVDKGLGFQVQGFLEFRNLEGRCLAVISAETSEGQELSWPLRAGLEILLQRVAGTLRSQVEKGKP